MQVRTTVLIMLMFCGLMNAKAQEEKKEQQQNVGVIMENVVNNVRTLFGNVTNLFGLLKKYNIPYAQTRVDFSKKFADDSGAGAGIGFDLLFSTAPTTFNGFEIIVYLDGVPEFLRSFFIEISRPMAQKLLLGNVTVSDDMRRMIMHSSPAVEYLVKISLLVKDFVSKAITPQEFVAYLLFLTLKCVRARDSLPVFWLDMFKGITIGDRSLYAFLEDAIKDAEDIVQWDFEDKSTIPEKEVTLMLKGIVAALMATVFEYLEERDAYFKTISSKEKILFQKEPKEYNKKIPGFNELIAKGGKRVLAVTSRYEPFKKVASQVFVTLKPVTFLIDSLGIPVSELLGVDEKEPSSEAVAIDTSFSLLPDFDSLVVENPIYTGLTHKRSY